MEMDRDLEVLAALGSVIDPDLGKSVVACGFIKDLRVDEGFVSFNLEVDLNAGLKG